MVDARNKGRLWVGDGSGAFGEDAAHWFFG